ncbi:MAG TPA: MaoC family dehydratase N-terminal domain-containing protein [Alphaproteobacteria bacterium]|nr:MaoC family dehydratase N-terminal domain-containing protein [Alphaproteobacteria bacterium]
MPDTVASTIDIDDLRRHIGSKVEDCDTITAWPMAAMNATLDRNEAVPASGTPIPQGWHQFWFLPTTRPGELGPDGAPTSSGVIPAMPLPRRMFAGTTWTFHEPLRIGDECRRETELTDIQMKSGTTGTLVFATVASRIHGPNGLAVEEERGTAFREAVADGGQSAAPKRETPPADTVWERTHVCDETLLFRFSALTFNTHRIHYDAPWAINVEGYPALVVHGPLSSTLLINFVRDMNPGKIIKTYRMRARAPLFANQPIKLVGKPTESGCDCWSLTPEGTIAMQINVTFA